MVQHTHKQKTVTNDPTTCLSDLTIFGFFLFTLDVFPSLVAKSTEFFRFLATFCFLLILLQSSLNPLASLERLGLPETCVAMTGGSEGGLMACKMRPTWTVSSSDTSSESPSTSNSSSLLMACDDSDSSAPPSRMKEPFDECVELHDDIWRGTSGVLRTFLFELNPDCPAPSLN